MINLFVCSRFDVPLQGRCPATAPRVQGNNQTQFTTSSAFPVSLTRPQPPTSTSSSLQLLSLLVTFVISISVFCGALALLVPASWLRTVGPQLCCERRARQKHHGGRNLAPLGWRLDMPDISALMLDRVDGEFHLSRRALPQYCTWNLDLTLRSAHQHAGHNATDNTTNLQSCCQTKQFINFHTFLRHQSFICVIFSFF